jgi:hypothetical protein
MPDGEHRHLPTGPHRRPIRITSARRRRATSTHRRPAGGAIAMTTEVGSLAHDATVWRPMPPGRSPSQAGRTCATVRTAGRVDAWSLCAAAQSRLLCICTYPCQSPRPAGHVPGFALAGHSCGVPSSPARGFDAHDGTAMSRARSLYPMCLTVFHISGSALVFLLCMRCLCTL